MGASSIITMQAKRLAWSLQGTDAQGFWDTAEDTHPSSCPGMEGGRQGLYTPIPTSHSLAEGCSPMLLSASALQHSDLLCTQGKWAPVIRGDFQQGPDPGLLALPFPTWYLGLFGQQAHGMWMPGNH